MNKSISEIKLGILGGGQLGRMLVQAAKEWNLDCYILDESSDFPAANVGATFIEGSFKSYEDVYNFGKNLDIITVEIEHVNIDALLKLQSEGKTIHPKPESLQIIKDKGLQKQFYLDNNFPTAPFRFYESKAEILVDYNKAHICPPFVQKSRTAGYDGKGVQLIKTVNDLESLMDIPCIIEDAIDIETEIAVIAARNEIGQVICYPAVDMFFHPEANLVEVVTYPSTTNSMIQEQAKTIAEKLINDLQICGLLAIEFFVSKDGKLLVNEIAPRPHNSGHITMNASMTSQFQQHLRGVCNLPLGNTDFFRPAVMMNLLGAEDYTGSTKYDNIEKCLEIDGAYIHLYGKKTTKPFRKMGHANILNDTLDHALEKAITIKETLKIIA